jgi:hypothetical protein
MKMRTEERLEIAKAKENYLKEFREVREEDTEMEEDERQAWRNVRNGIDTFEEERTVQNAPRGAQGGSSGEEKEVESRSKSVSQSGRMVHHHQHQRKYQEEGTYTKRQEEEDQHSPFTPEN